MERGYKLLLALTLSLALLLGMTATASAAPATAVYINGTALDASTPYYQGGVALATVTNLNNTAWFDAATNTLTLNNATIDATSTGGHAIQGDGDLTIKLMGENTVTAGAGLVGIIVRGDSERLLTIMGESGASLTVLGGQDGINVEQGASLAISNAAVTATGTTGRGIAASNVTITDSTVTATGNTIGIFSENAVTIDSSTVTATGIAGRGIAAGDVTIDHSTVTAEGDEDGIFSAGAVTITDSAVNVNGGMDGIVSLQTITISNSTVTANGTTNRGMNGGADIIIENNSTVTASGEAQGIHSVLPITIDHSTVTANSTTDTGLLSNGEVTITDSAVDANGDLEGICSHGGAITISNSTVAAKGTRQHGILSSRDVIITDSTVTAEGIVGVGADTLTIGDNCTVNITANDAAILTNSPLDFPHGNWYQWKGDDDTLYRSGIGADDRLLTKEDGAANKSLKIEPIATEPNTHTVTLVNGDKVWHVFTGISDGQTLRAILTMPPPLEGGPAGSIFYRWYTESDEWIRHDTVINEDKVAYATWKQPIAGTVTFSGEPVVGQPITATATVTTAGVTTLNYQWLLGERRIPIDGATSATYTPTAADAGQLLICVVNNIEIVPGSIVAEAGIVKEGNSGGGYYPIYIPTAPQESPELVTSPETFDSGIATSMVLTLLTATGAAWLGKKKD